MEIDNDGYHINSYSGLYENELDEFDMINNNDSDDYLCDYLSDDDVYELDMNNENDNDN